MKNTAPLITAFALAGLALVGAADKGDSSFVSSSADVSTIDTTTSDSDSENTDFADDELASVISNIEFGIVNNTTTPASPADADVDWAEGDLLYNCGGTRSLLTLAKDASVDLECSGTSILYQVPGQIGPYRLDFSCQYGQKETFTFTGSGGGVTSTSSCAASSD